MSYMLSTVGLRAYNSKCTQRPNLVQVQYVVQESVVTLTPVSGHNLAQLPGQVFITLEEFADRPTDPYDSIPEAAWALEKCGYVLCRNEE